MVKPKTVQNQPTRLIFGSQLQFDIFQRNVILTENQVSKAPFVRMKSFWFHVPKSTFFFLAVLRVLIDVANVAGRRLDRRREEDPGSQGPEAETESKFL